jgi:hypothetical protein
MLKYYEIFVPGGFPRHTYNPRAELRLENRLMEAKRNLCKLVTVTGQTKSGKTVLARKILPPEECIWVDGGTVSEEDDFWHVVIEQLELFQSKQKEIATEVFGKIGVSTKVIRTEIGRKKFSGVKSTQTLSSRVIALRGLKESLIPLVVDDFHYIPKELQGSIVRALKPLIFDGLPTVIIAIPHRRYDALKVEKEMTGRIFTIDIPIWSEDELRYIPTKGFDLLNYDVSSPTSNKIAKEAIGSPHLMQDYCREISKYIQIEYALRRRTLNLPEFDLDKIFIEVAETIGRPIFEKLARGPRQRTDRIQRQLKNGQAVDIYELVLHGMAYLKPGLVSIEYEELRSAIRNVSASQIPQLQEIARVLKHMATIAATDQSSTPVIDFEESEKKLHITDPFFAFYLRWGELGH